VNNLRSKLADKPKLFLLVSSTWRFVRYFLIAIRLKGARSVGVDEFENGLLVLNRTTSLGERGELVTTPRDETIYRFVVEHGEWEPDESLYLSNRLIAAEDVGENALKIALVDIGANSGLVTRQVLTLSGSACEVILVEPIPNHVIAIQANLKKWGDTNQVRIVEAALGETNGQSEISIEKSNRGNSSLLSSAMPASGTLKLSVEILAVEDFFKGFLSNFDHYIIKSDTQGYDSRILSLLPIEFWNKCQGAVIEVWALPEIEVLPVQVLLTKWHSYWDFNWAADGSSPTNLEEIESFWLSKSGKSKNLFINCAR